MQETIDYLINLHFVRIWTLRPQAVFLGYEGPPLYTITDGGVAAITNRKGKL
jgi:hypothetical protein